MGYKKITDELPPEGEEVIFFNKKWIDEDFNPKGTRIGVYYDIFYKSAKWCGSQDCYNTMSNLDGDKQCCCGKESDQTPTHWIEIPKHPSAYTDYT